MGRKIIIKVPGTSANFGIGFDCLGAAIDLYNTYIFEENETSILADELVNFNEFNDVKNNLVLSSYKIACQKLKIKEKNIKITQLNNEIPPTRGLGSSAACIISGIVGAYLINNIPINEKAIIALATEIEKHPDNVLPCFKGGLKAIINDNNEILDFDIKINKKLNFYLLIPDFTIKTTEARAVLPSSLTYQQVVNNLSRSMVFTTAMKNGNIKLLNKVLKDELHENYRYPLIPDGFLIKKALNKVSMITLISGAGPTLIVISNEKKKEKINEVLNSLTLTNRWLIKEITISPIGVQYYEE